MFDMITRDDRSKDAIGPNPMCIRRNSCAAEKVASIHVWMKHSIHRAVSFILLIAIGGLSACNSAPKAASKKTDDEYVYVTLTGSNIPVKIKKSDIAAGKVSKEVQAQLMDKDAFQKSMRPGRAMDTGK